MSTFFGPFLGEIVMFAGKIAPTGWAFCNGQLLQISGNTALFSILGTLYGGDGETTFGLPDMRDRAPMQPRTGPGLSSRSLGQRAGVATATLTEAQLPEHTHQLFAHEAPDPTPFADTDKDVPAATTSLGEIPGSALGLLPDLYGADTGALVDMADEALTDVTRGVGHENRQPFLGINFIIALAGIFPTRN